MMRAPLSSLSSSCILCQIACSSTYTALLHSDEKVVAFQDINPSAFRHHLIIPIEHIPTIRNLQRRAEDFSLDLVFINLLLTALIIPIFIA